MADLPSVRGFAWGLCLVSIALAFGVGVVVGRFAERSAHSELTQIPSEDLDHTKGEEPSRLSASASSTPKLTLAPKFRNEAANLNTGGEEPVSLISEDSADSKEDERRQFLLLKIDEVLGATRPLLLSMPSASQRLLDRVLSISEQVDSDDVALRLLEFELSNAGKWEMRHVSEFLDIIGPERRAKLEALLADAPPFPCSDLGTDNATHRRDYKKWFEVKGVRAVMGWDRFLRPGPWTESPSSAETHAKLLRLAQEVRSR